MCVNLLMHISVYAYVFVKFYCWCVLPSQSVEAYVRMCVRSTEVTQKAA